MKTLSSFLCSECQAIFRAQYPRYGTDESGLVLCDILCDPCADEAEQEFERDRMEIENARP